MDCPICRSPNEAGARSCVGCGSSLPPGPGALVAGRFELISALGAGGMGTVFKARDRKLEVEVALKVLRLGRDRLAMLRFHSEVRLARSVRHRNVCGVHEYGEDGDVVFCVMELVRGRTLRQLLQEAPLAWDEAFRITLDAAAGLQAIHEAGVVHRDVKSSNLMVDARGEVRLVDFGIAKPGPSASEQQSSETSATEASQVVGSPEYMSPEQVRGVPLDARSDIYSFGLLVYEAFAGSLPFHGATPRDVMLRRLEVPPSFGGATAARLPPALVPVLQKALAKEPAGRQGSMAELIAELSAVQARVRESGTEVMPAARPGGRARRAAAAALLVSGIALLGYLGRGMVMERMRVRRASPPAAQGPPVQAPAAAAATTLTPSPPAAAPGRELPSPSARTHRRTPKVARGVTPGLPSASAEEKRPTPESSTVGPPSGPPASVAPRPGDAVAGSAAGLVPTEATAAAAAKAVPTLTPPATPTPTPPTPTPIPPSRGELLAGSDPEVVPARCAGAQIRYCPQAESLRIEGQVLIDVLVREDGSVSDPVLVRADDDVLRDCGLRSVARLHCQPASRRGVPGRMRRTVLFDFRLPR